MKTLFFSQDLWDFVEDGYTEQDAHTLDGWSQDQRNQLKENRNKDSKALFLIHQEVHDSIFPRLVGVTKSKEAWDALQKGSDKVKIVKLQSLKREFETLCMKSSKFIQYFLTRVMGIVNEIRSYGEYLKDQKIVEKILRSLHAKFDGVVVAIDESNYLTQLSVNELMGSLQSHEERINRSFEKTKVVSFMRKARTLLEEEEEEDKHTEEAKVEEYFFLHTTKEEKMASSGKTEIENFNGHSFELWKLNMEDMLVDKDQWIVVDPGTKPTGVTDEE
eukprot:PITA_10642